MGKRLIPGFQLVLLLVLLSQPLWAQTCSPTAPTSRPLHPCNFYMTIGLRVSEEEIQGLDLSQHGQEGYYWEASA
jgi:hypothetical protein